MISLSFFEVIRSPSIPKHLSTLKVGSSSSTFRCLEVVSTQGSPWAPHVDRVDCGLLQLKVIDINAGLSTGVSGRTHLSPLTAEGAKKIC